MVYGLAGVLAIALLIAAFTDLRRRQIDNWLNAAIAALASSCSPRWRCGCGRCCLPSFC